MLIFLQWQIYNKNNGKLLDIQVEAKMDPSEERFKFANKANILKFTVPVINDDEQSCNNIHVDRVKVILRSCILIMTLK